MEVVYSNSIVAKIESALIKAVEDNKTIERIALTDKEFNELEELIQKQGENLISEGLLLYHDENLLYLANIEIVRCK